MGERSSHTWFVLHEILGESHVKSYDGSLAVQLGFGAGHRLEQATVRAIGGRKEENAVRERYIRPPLVATEAPSVRAATWRFRIVSTILALLLVWAGVVTVRSLGLLVQDTGGGIDRQPSAPPAEGEAPSGGEDGVP